MAIWPLVFMLSSSTLLAQSREERALRLNEEMEFLLGVASKPHIWRSSELPSRLERSGPAPTQMEGVENLEQRFFRDEVNFQAARAEAVDDPEPSFEEAEKAYRLDGSVPRTR